MFDVDTINQINAEEKQYKLWAKEKMNSILRIANCDKKRAVYQQNFPKIERSDDYLAGNIF